MRRPNATLRYAFLASLFLATGALLSTSTAAEVQYSEPELRSYAFANASVRLIQGGLDRQLIESQTDAQATRQLQEAAQEQTSAAIGRAGLTESEYETMTRDIAADAELSAIVRGYVDQELGIVR